MREEIKKGLEAMGIDPCEFAIEKLDDFVKNLLAQNQVMNLTAITEESQVLGLHLLDSAALLPFVPEKAKSLIDIGTGAGFPGVPLQILRPQLSVTLMDALEKRLKWLAVMAQELDLPNMSTLHGRGEDLPHKLRHREVYDVATARAVADLRILSEIALPFLKEGGTFLAMKSRDTGGEITMAIPTIRAMGGELMEVYDYDIPNMNVVHRIVVIEKVSPTPEDYPRRWAKIKNTPITD
ncbi:MAG: 16S rRNA (guanine(527)-N(7))-methyltransferase RsmG [Eubacteriales bacterium]